MKVRIGLLGFGRIGRNVFRLLANHPSLEVVAISDTISADALVNGLKYDSVFGRFSEAVTLDAKFLHTCGKKVALLGPEAPAWNEHKVDIVIEATGKLRTHAQAKVALDKGAKRVILCAPCADADVTVLTGVNHQALTAQHRIIAHGSPAGHAGAAVAKILDEAFGLERVFFTEVGAYGNDQRLADVPGLDLRRSRAAAENIVPTPPTAVEDLTCVLPSLRGKISGMALRVPVANGSMVDMVSFTQKPISVQSANEAVRAAAEGAYRGILEYCTDPIVSSDVQRAATSGTYDSHATMVLGSQAIKTITWYDSSWGYAMRAVQLIEHLANMQGGLS